MSDHVEAAKGPASRRAIITRVVIVALVATVGFLTGFLPEKIQASRAASELDQIQEEVRLMKIQADLASATIDARRGEYERARKEASQFFTGLRAEVDRGEESALSGQQRERAAALLTPRDDIITLLARGDPVSAERLSDCYVRYRNSTAEAGVEDSDVAAQLTAR
jgi:hypothetical protein